MSILIPIVVVPKEEGELCAITSKNCAKDHTCVPDGYENGVGICIKHGTLCSIALNNCAEDHTCVPDGDDNKVGICVPSGKTIVT